MPMMITALVLEPALVPSVVVVAALFKMLSVLAMPVMEAMLAIFDDDARRADDHTNGRTTYDDAGRARRDDGDARR